MSETAPGWQAMRLRRNRFWGHPDMISFIERLSFKARETGWPRLYVGDISQPRGGPMRSGHRSHQIGLDADIWLRIPDWKDLSAQDRESISSHVVVAADGISMNEHWTPSHHDVLRAAAEDEAVARVFVNPAIKRALCEGERDANGAIDAPWLRKIRPWKGHNAHFHVRLHCPPGAPICREQEPPPPGDGCGAELAAWFPKGKKVADVPSGKTSEEATLPVVPTRSVRRELVLADLPKACQAVLTDDGAALADLAALGIGAGAVNAAPLFFEDAVHAHNGFIGTDYYWTPPIDLNAAEQRQVSLEIEGDLPPGLEFVDRGDGAALVRGTPQAEGVYIFDLVADRRGEDQGRLTVSLAIDALNIQAGQPTEELSREKSLAYQIEDFMANFSGDECFYANPVRIAANSSDVEAFSDRPAPFFTFDDAFKAAIGFEARIGGRLVAPAQCEAVRFVRAFRHNGEGKPVITMDTVVLAEESPVSGRITGEAVRYITLLLVKPSGRIIDLSDYLERRGDTLFFNLIVPGKGPMLLVAVDTSFPLVRTDFLTAGQVDGILENLRSGNTSRHYDMKTSLGYFVLQ